MSAEKPLRLHEFHSPNQLPLSWNSIYGAIAMLDQVDILAPVALEVGNRMIRVCLTPAEAGELGAFLDENKDIIAGAMGVHAWQGGADAYQAIEQTEEFFDRAVTWFDYAHRAGDFVTVVPVPSRQ